MKCYDGAVGDAHQYRNDYEQRFRETQEAQRQCAQSCASQNKAWNFANGNCVCSEGSREDYSEFYKEPYREPSEFEQQPPPGEFTEPQPTEEFTQPPTEWSGTTSGEGTTTQTEPTTTSESSGTSSSSGEGSGSITGSVISGNGFLDYYFK